MEEKFKKPYHFLDKHKVAVLSTSDGKNEILGAAIYYAADKSLNFYFLTRTGSKKYEHIRKNPHCALTVADDDTQATVQVTGIVEEVPIGEEQNEAYRKLVLVHPPGEFSWRPPVSKLTDGGTVLLRLRPSVLQYADFTTKSHSSADHIERII